MCQGKKAWRQRRYEKCLVSLNYRKGWDKKKEKTRPVFMSRTLTGRSLTELLLLQVDTLEWLRVI